MAKQYLIDRMRAMDGHLTESVPDAVYAQYLDDAAAWIIDYCNRADWLALPIALEAAQSYLALSWYGKRGQEGVASGGEGGVTRVYEDAPQRVIKVLQRYKAATLPRMNRAYTPPARTTGDDTL